MAASDSPLPIHFLTIVLNGLPYIRHHIDVFRNLPFRWHWHIVEGAAELTNDTAWSVATGGRVPDSHDRGRSRDGTSEYLDQLVAEFPENITVHRKPLGQLWDGKREMVNAPIPNIREECLLWQLDVDELWTAEQFVAARELFLRNPEKTAARYWCWVFVGPDITTISRGLWGNKPEEWLRTWRFRPGMQWAAHEPPILAERVSGDQWRNVATVNPFTQQETEAAGLVFQHYAYATRKQLEFKEVYYGQAGVVARWEQLQRVQDFPVRIRDYFYWVTDDSLVDRANRHVGRLLIDLPAVESSHASNILVIRTDSIGDNVLAAGILPELAKAHPQARITFLCHDGVAPLYEHCPFVHELIVFNKTRALQEPAYREHFLPRLRTLHADLCLNTVYSRETLGDFFAINSGAKEIIAHTGDSSNIDPAIRARNDAHYTRLIRSPGTWASELTRNADFLRGLGIEPARPLAPMVWTSPEDRRMVAELFAQQQLDPAKTIAVFAAAQWEIKAYPRFGEALAAVCREHGFKLVALGVASEAAWNQQCLQDASVPGINLCGRLTLRQTAEVLRSCRLAVGTDTGSAHIACAVGTPAVIVLGGGHFGRFFPYSPLTSIICNPITCFGCNWRCRYSRAHCIKDVVPEVIEHAIREALARRNELPRLYLQDKFFSMPFTDAEQYLLPDLLPPLLMDAILVAPMGTPLPRVPPATISGCIVQYAYVPRRIVAAPPAPPASPVAPPSAAPASNVQVLGKNPGGGIVVSFGKPPTP